MADEKEKKATKVKRPTALKRDMQHERRRLANKSFKAEVSTAIRTLKTNAQKGDKTLVKDQLAAVYSLMDKGVKTGVFKQNKASRDKSRISQSVKAAL